MLHTRRNYITLERCIRLGVVLVTTMLKLHIKYHICTTVVHKVSVRGVYYTRLRFT
jgi:hypothetical protein